jgi:arachidonate 5-lipoxygenase
MSQPSIFGYLYAIVKAVINKIVLWLLSIGFAIGLSIFLSFPHRYRMSHNNGIAGRGRVRIVDDPTFPPHDFFEPGRSFDCRVRHASATFLDDAMNCIRSFSIKFSDHWWNSPFDIEMNTGTINLFWSAVSFMKFGKLRKQQWGIEYHDYYRIYPQGILGAQLSLRRDPSSFQNLRYQALTPYRFVGKDGIKRYAKYRTMPLDKAPETGITPNMSDWDTCNQRILPTETRGRNYLKDEYKQRMANGGASYLMQIQLRTASDDDNPEIFNNQLPWDEDIFPWQDLAVVDITETLSWKESLKTSFSLNHMPKNLDIIPAKSIFDYNSLNYMRSHSEMARKARLLSYRVFGYPPEIPDDDNRNVSDWNGKS